MTTAIIVLVVGLLIAGFLHILLSKTIDADRDWETERILAAQEQDA